MNGRNDCSWIIHYKQTNEQQQQKMDQNKYRNPFPSESIMVENSKSFNIQQNRKKKTSTLCVW